MASPEEISMRIKRAVVAVLAVSTVSIGLNGCGDDAKTGTIEVSPEAKKADEGGRKAMQDYMQSKGQAKKR